jgi:pyrroline-5-carboxylate reductase
MASSLIGGMIANGMDADDIIACDISAAPLKALQDQFSIQTSSDSLTAATQADIIVLAVVHESDINRWLGGSKSIVRCMPNTPALLQLGATGLYANPQTSDTQKQVAQSILDAVGITVWVEEEILLDAVTAISGSGPAYFFYFIELLQAAGEKLGLNADTAIKLAKQTALGAAHMAQHDDVADLRARVTSKNGTTEQAILRARVTSKNGTTEQAILSFQKNGLGELVDAATKAASERAAELARELSNPPKTNQ